MKALCYARVPHTCQCSGRTGKDVGKHDAVGLSIIIPLYQSWVSHHSDRLSREQVDYGATEASQNVHAVEGIFFGERRYPVLLVVDVNSARVRVHHPD